MFPTSSCGQVYLSGLCFGGALHGSVPRPHRVVCAKPKRKTHILTTCPPVLCLWHSQFEWLGLCWDAGRFYQNQTIPFNDETLGQNIKDASTITHHSPPPSTNSLASSTKVGHKLPERRLSLSTNARFGGYAHVGDAIPHTHSKHINFQQHDVTNQATINKYQTPIPNYYNSSLKQQHV